MIMVSELLQYFPTASEIQRIRFPSFEDIVLDGTKVLMQKEEDVSPSILHGENPLWQS